MPNNTILDPSDTEAGFNGGIAQIGYGAVKTAGIKNQGKITARDIEQGVSNYLDTLWVTDLGLKLPRNKIYTQQGGTYSSWGNI
jgi:hypothetical protein